MSEITALDKRSVHRICSGQVVLTLGICVKELLENALDAGAMRVEIGFMESGVDLISVSDDGHGVQPHNYPGLALKHHTSKIRDFVDVATVDTFGFRGEALSSLCALSHLSVMTRTEADQIGTELIYDHSGTLISSKNTPRDKGTSIALKDLFYTLPVRRAEFKKHIKREFGKMLTILTSYALISPKLRLFCWNNVKGKRSTVLQTHGRGPVREALKDVFGSKSLKDLHEIDADNGTVQIKGFVSSVKHGEGRNAPDRQFLYLNHRPADMNKIRRRINETYKSYNRHQYPFIFLDVITDKSKVDINVTPDKRQIFVENETAIIEFLQQTLGTLYEDTPSTFDVTPLSESIFEKFESSFESKASKRSLSSSIVKEPSKRTKTQSNHDEFVPEKILNVSLDKNEQSTGLSLLEKEEKPPTPIIVKKTVQERSQEQHSDEKVFEFLKKHLDSSQKKTSEEKPNVNKSPSKHTVLKERNVIQYSPERKPTITSPPSKPLPVSPSFITDEDEVIDKSKRRFVTVDFDFAKISSSVSEGEGKNESYRKFFAQISPEENKSAEEELQKSIKKENFKEMQILGQFNLGFIICLLGRDIFIVDQHATDEKYNFEDLKRTCRLEPQNMVFPQTLELTYANETLLSEHMDVFRDNGFEFDFDEDSSVGSRFKLKRVPMYRNWSFGKSDVEELIFMLGDHDPSRQKLRPSKVRAMFASRACRSSVMIGTALSRRDMRRLIDHMAEMDQPWNCPHGRPTMRHLINLALLK